MRLYGVFASTLRLKTLTGVVVAVRGVRSHTGAATGTSIPAPGLTDGPASASCGGDSVPRSINHTGEHKFNRYNINKYYHIL